MHQSSTRIMCCLFDDCGFYFPGGIIIRTNIEGSKANMEIVFLLRQEKEE